jgi:hypothetical protein
MARPPAELDLHITSPAPDSVPEGHILTLAGTVISHTQPVSRVQIMRRNELLVSTGVREEPRPELTRVASTSPVPSQVTPTSYSFAFNLEALALDPRFEMRLWAVLADRSRVSLAMIRGRRRSVLAGYRPRRQPLMVTSLGRTGSTWLMRLLAEHPAVLTYRKYPYEVRPAKYWLHLFRVLSSRPNPAKVVGQPQEFHLETLAAGANPFRAPSFAAIPELEAWSGGAYVERLAAFCQESIDQWYEIVATAQDEKPAIYFAEKQFPDDFPRLAWSIYPGAREVILVRDFRDMVASMLAYNRKRGFDDFSRVGREDDEAWVKSLRSGVNALTRAWQQRRDRAYLVRYEDLITDPPTTMAGVFEYLGVDASAEQVAEVIKRTSADPTELKQHQTTTDPAASIGRWRQDLPSVLQAAANQAFRRGLKTFGYEPE